MVFTTCSIPAEALKPCSLNVPVAILYLLPEILTVTVQAANTLEKKWFLKKLRHDLDSNGMMHSSHQMHMPPQPLSDTPESKDLGERSQQKLCCFKEQVRDRVLGGGGKRGCYLFKKSLLRGYYGLGTVF